MTLLEPARIRCHLSAVERELRTRDVGQLPPALQEARTRHLGELHAYWVAGRFPHNHDAPGRVPCFIDDHDGRCAVAHLLIADGQEALARRIAARFRNHYLPEMVDDELARWVASSGLTLEELARIQPTYDSNWGNPDFHDCHVACFVCDQPAEELYEVTAEGVSPTKASSAKALYPTRLATSPEGALFAMRGQGIERLRGPTWEEITARGDWIRAFAGDELLYRGNEGLVRRDARGQVTVLEPMPKAATRMAAAGVVGDFWVVGLDDALHVVRGNATPVVLPAELVPGDRTTTIRPSTVASAGPGDAWFVGIGPGILHWNGEGFEGFTLPEATPGGRPQPHNVVAVATVGPGDVWFGGHGVLAHYARGTVTAYDVPGQDVHALAATGPRDVWALRNGWPGVLHWDGKAWREILLGDVLFGQVASVGPGRAVVTGAPAECVQGHEDYACRTKRRQACDRGKFAEPQRLKRPHGLPAMGVTTEVRMISTVARPREAKAETAVASDAGPPPVSTAPEAAELRRKTTADEARPWWGIAVAVLLALAGGGAWWAKGRLSGGPRPR